MSARQDEVTLCGVRTIVQRAGEGPPLLVLEGANNIEGWLPLYDRLARNYTVLLPRHPGYGGDGVPEWLDRVPDMANFYLDLLDGQDLRDVRLLGFSLGGWIAAELAVRNATRLHSLALVAPMGVYLPGCEPLDIFLRTDDQMIDSLFHAPELAARIKPDALDPAREDTILHNRVTTAKLCWQPRFYDPALARWLHRIKLPTTVVWGEEDAVLPAAYAQEWGRLVPHAQTHVIPNCGHAPQIEADERLEGILREAFAGGKSS
jgi:pimeloyl-ACP methyl ester carboxylesterase